MAKTYPDISDHGLIGDLQTAALVSTDGTIDWFCCPRFDSPSVFGSLLDPERGGFFRVRPIGAEYVTRQLYLPDTAILITRFLTDAGVGEVIDFMPVADGVETDRHAIVRMVRVVRGEMTFEGEIQPRFDYGRAPHRLVRSGVGAKFVSDDLTITLHRVGEPVVHDDERAARVEVVGEGVRVSITLRAGELTGVMLESGDVEARQISEDELVETFLATRRYWRGWVDRSTYTGRWREMVTRSAITLKLMTYAPTGALIAAPTASLPEQVGGGRNWDYRYTWVRDASFSVYALLSLGYDREAEAFVGWLLDRIHEQPGGEGGPLRIMYRVDGSADLDEAELEHLAGYRGSQPVRVGNGASGQLQLDIYGEAMDSIRLADTHGVELSHAGWVKVRSMLDWLCDHWDTPEEGIWETRGGPQRFTYGRFMSWVALDRGIRLAEAHGRPSSFTRWMHERDRIYERIMEVGFDPERGAFVQHEEATCSTPPCCGCRCSAS
ncbi:glucoamylase [Agromyces marinus]|uniref:Glucoamylase n=1 Tax=Agromyces marinus TaxID=1389020 RepID=A0ABN6YEU6_9MICO|nr:glycoside hydrolase family 15 protein [Agromyces marinus]BDZ54437.1 glucoamylase [Agromyces marinus]